MKKIIAIVCLIWLSGCVSYYEAADDIKTGCVKTDMYALQIQGLPLRIWDCAGVQVEGSIVGEPLRAGG